MNLEDLPLAQRLSVENIPLAKRLKSRTALDNIPLAKRLKVDNIPLAKRLKAKPSHGNVPRKEIVVVDIPQQAGRPPILQQIGVFGEPGKPRTLADVQRAAEPLMQKHLPGWWFTFDKSTSRAGVCKFNTQTIALSEAFVLSKRVADIDVLETILHEIAHGIAGHNAHHGPVWKKIAMDLGCTGNRCHSFSFSTARFKMECACGAVDRYKSRVKPGAAFSCKKCKGDVKVTNTGITKRGVRD